MKKICIFGAGAIGGYLACSLKNTNNKISIVARGQHKEIIEKKGLTLIKDEIKKSNHYDISENASDLGKQDYIFVTLKAHSVPGCLDAFEVLMKEDTSFVWGVNGIPWWYFYKANTGYIFNVYGIIQLFYSNIYYLIQVINMIPLEDLNLNLFFFAFL